MKNCKAFFWNRHMDVFFFQKEIHYTNLKVCAIKKVLCLINEVIFERSLHS